MLLPAPLSRLSTVEWDKRGPWRVEDPEALIAQSMGQARNGGKLPIDVNHSTQKLGEMGFEAPARGWITAMLVRDGALWARVEWTEAGRAMVAAREYLSISPVIMPDAAGVVRRILGASLTNDPALMGLATLTTRETPMNDLLAQLARKLGKPDTATAEECLTAIPDPAAAVALTALQADVATLLAALGAKDMKEAVVAAKGFQSAASQVETLTARLLAVERAGKRQAAEAWMASELSAKRGIPQSDQEDLILLHMEDPGRAKKYARLHPALGEITHLGGTPPGAGSLAVTLTADQVTAKANALIAERKAAGADITFLEAIQAVSEKLK
jgi:hypothetical protein